MRATNDTLAESSYGDGDLDIVDAVNALAKGRHLPMAQVALAWVLTKPGVCAPVVGATKPDHIRDAIAAIDVTLTGDEIARLEAPYRAHSIIGH